MEGQVVANLRESVLPLLSQLQKSHLNQKQRAQVRMLVSKLREVFKPFLSNILSDHTHLTPVEIQVAHLIKENKSSKDIAQLLNLSIRTVGCYRENIREKLKLKNKKVNLRSYLVSCDNTAV